MDAKDSPQLSWSPRDSLRALKIATQISTVIGRFTVDKSAFSGVRGCNRYPQGPPAHKYPPGLKAILLFIKLSLYDGKRLRGIGGVVQIQKAWPNCSSCASID
jgi:hypothetical protein